MTQQATAVAQADRLHSLQSLQILRGVAALGVLLVHLSMYVEGKLGLTGQLPRMLWGAAGVDLFFVISGFIMVYASDGLFGRPGAPLLFFARRLARIVPLYWAASGILLGYLVWTAADFAAADLTWGVIAASFLFVPYSRPDGLMWPLLTVGWTLNYEMFFYLVFAAALLLTRRAAVIAITALFVVIVALGAMLPSRPPWFDFLSSPMILEFCFGMLIALGYLGRVRLPSPAAIGLVVASCAAFVASAQWGGMMGRVIEWGLPAAGLVAGLVWLSRAASLGILGRALAYLGDASYSLYLLHTLVLLAVPRLLLRLVDPASAPWLCVVAMFLAPIGVALAAHALFERPVTRWLQARIGARAAAPAREPALSELVPAVTNAPVFRSFGS